MMTRRERLQATLYGKPVDRPAVSFYEIGMFRYDPDDPDPYNVHNDPSWRDLLELTEAKTDIIRNFTPLRKFSPAFSKTFRTEIWEESNSRFDKTRVEIAGRTLQSQTRRDAHVDTVWTIEHLLKDADDLRAYLEIPDDVFSESIDMSGLPAADAALGDSGILLLDTYDPIGFAASLFDMSDYLIIAMTEGELFHALLEKILRILLPKIQTIAQVAPGQLWRICGPEYASEPYLPPRLFEEYCVKYTRPLVETIQQTKGFVRLHSHGRLKNILPLIASMGVDGLDPIEPPHQGDVDLVDVRRDYGEKMVLFGNLEITDIENLPPVEFEVKVRRALEEGTTGQGRGFVLMPSACPYGRTITSDTLENYKTMVRLAENW